jgi:hypothetical protein
MSVALMRDELLDLLGWLTPDKTWPKRVAAHDIAAFTIEQLPESVIRQLPKPDQSKGFRALHLAETIVQRTR